MVKVVTSIMTHLFKISSKLILEPANTIFIIIKLATDAEENCLAYRINLCTLHTRV